MATPDTLGSAEMPAHIAEALAEAEDATAADIKKRLEQAEEQAAAPDLDAETLKRMEVNYTFDFEYPAPEDRRPGEKVYKAKFTNTMASIQIRRKIGITRASLGGGVPFEQLDPFTRELNLIVAHLTWTLDATANPEGHWSRSLENIYDYELLQTLYGQVVMHENTFLGRV